MPVHHNATQASLCAELGHYELAQRMGCDALIEQDALSRQQAAIHLQVIAFSLYGNEPLYGEGAVLNARFIQTHMPQWVMRVYHDDSLPEDLIVRLQQLGAQTFHVSQLGIAHWPGTFWRFYALNDPHVERVLFRDADSIISQRELSLIEAWCDSHLPFHVVRDWYTHVELMLAGLWGAHAPYLLWMKQWIEHYLAHEREHTTHDDQIFLAKHVWPRIYRHTLIHDSIHPVLGAKDIPIPREHQGVEAAMGNYAAIAYPVHTDQTQPIARYFVRITEAQTGDQICRYERTALNGTDQFRIPFEYETHIRSGLWRIEVGEC